jgi:oxalate decarboxylase
MADDHAKVSRRKFIGVSSAALAAAAAMQSAQAQNAVPDSPQAAEAANKAEHRTPDHHLPNEKEPGPKNAVLDGENTDSVWSPETDAGAVNPFKYSFSLSHKRIEAGGWTRQVTERDLPISKTIAGVEMRLVTGGVRELHWHTSAEWALMLYGNARITAVDQDGNSFVSDVTKGDLWLFPGGIPHSIQGLGPDGARFLLVFNDGSFNEFETFLITDWLTHTPPEVLGKNFGVAPETFKNVPKKELFMFPTELPRPLEEEKREAAEQTGVVPKSFDFRPSQMKPTKVSSGGEVKIIDQKVFPATPITAAIVTLKPGGLREMHWHPHADEWQYYVSGKGRMTTFAGAGRARTMDFQEGDVGYVTMSTPHYVENTGDIDLVFLEMFANLAYEDVSLAEWMAHTPTRLVNEHLGVGETMLRAIRKKKGVITPA